MNSKIIPYCNFFGRPTNIIASIDKVDDRYVSGHVHMNDGLAVPFKVEHEGDSFYWKGKRFYFVDWKKLKA